MTDSIEQPALELVRTTKLVTQDMNTKTVNLVVTS